MQTITTLGLNQLTSIQVVEKLFTIERKKEYQTDSGKPSWLCKLTSSNVTHDRCVLKVCSVTEFDLVGQTIQDLRATTKDAWVLIVRTNSGVLKGKFAWVDNQWKLTEPA